MVFRTQGKFKAVPGLLLAVRSGETLPDYTATSPPSERPQANTGCEQGLGVNLVLTRAFQDKFPGQIPATILETMDTMESL